MLRLNTKKGRIGNYLSRHLFNKLCLYLGFYNKTKNWYLFAEAPVGLKGLLLKY